MVRLFHPLRLMAIALTAAAVPTAVTAAPVGSGALGAGYSAADAILGTATNLEIALQGEVAARCRMTTAPVFGGRLDVAHSGSAGASFALDCNTPFVLRMRSSAGGMVTHSPLEGVASRIAYDVGIAVETVPGSAPLGWCPADQLVDDAGQGCAFGAAGWSSGESVAIGREGRLSVRWAAPASGAALPLGEYRDTIVIELAVRS